MESIKTQETGWLQHGLLIMAGLVAILMVAASTTFLVRHYTGSSSSSTPATTHSVGLPAGTGADAKSGYGVEKGPAAQPGGPVTAHHQ